MTAISLPHGIEANGINQEDLYKLLVGIVAICNELKLDMNRFETDTSGLRTQYTALLADMANRISNHNTLVTKLNADAGVTDTNYASATAITAASLTAATVTTIDSNDLTLNQG